jgi:hypothetical protein
VKLSFLAGVKLPEEALREELLARLLLLVVTAAALLLLARLLLLVVTAAALLLLARLLLLVVTVPALLLPRLLLLPDTLLLLEPLPNSPPPLLDNSISPPSDFISELVNTNS